MNYAKALSKYNDLKSAFYLTNQDPTEIYHSQGWVDTMPKLAARSIIGPREFILILFEVAKGKWATQLYINSLDEDFPIRLNGDEECLQVFCDIDILGSI